MVGLAYALAGKQVRIGGPLAQEALPGLSRGNCARVRTTNDAWVRRVVTNLSMSAPAAICRGEGLSVDWATEMSCLSLRGRRVLGGVRSLPRRQAQAIALHYLEDLPWPRSPRSSASPGTVKKHLFEGRRPGSTTPIEEEDDELTRTSELAEAEGSTWPWRDGHAGAFGRRWLERFRARKSGPKVADGGRRTLFLVRRVGVSFFSFGPSSEPPGP